MTSVHLRAVGAHGRPGLKEDPVPSSGDLLAQLLAQIEEAAARGAEKGYERAKQAERERQRQVQQARDLAHAWIPTEAAAELLGWSVGYLRKRRRLEGELPENQRPLTAASRPTKRRRGQGFDLEYDRAALLRLKGERDA